MMPFNSTVNQLNDDAFDNINHLIQEALDARIAPAVTLAVYHQNDLLIDAGWGWHHPDEKIIEVRPTDYFDLASVTKLYTVIALLTLMSDKGLSVSTPLVDIVPEFGKIALRPIDGGQDPHSKARQAVDPNFAGQTVDPKTVTLFHLLTHTSGLAPWRDVYTVAPAPVRPSETDPIPQAERWSRALERLCAYPFVAPPDTDVRYSDLGLMLLGEVVARLSGKTLDQAIYNLVDKDVTYRPMANGITIDEIIPTEVDATWRKRRVHGQVHDENACGVGGIAGHAGLFASAMTVANLGKNWLDRTFEISPELYDSSVMVQARTGLDVRGLGWALRSSDGSSSGNFFSADSYGHTGFTGTSLWIDPQRQLVVALLTNRVYDGREKVGIHALRRAIHDAVAKAVDA